MIAEHAWGTAGQSLPSAPSGNSGVKKFSPTRSDAIAAHYPSQLPNCAPRHWLMRRSQRAGGQAWPSQRRWLPLIPYPRRGTAGAREVSYSDYPPLPSIGCSAKYFLLPTAPLSIWRGCSIRRSAVDSRALLSVDCWPASNRNSSCFALRKRHHVTVPMHKAGARMAATSRTP